MTMYQGGSESLSPSSPFSHIAFIEQYIGQISSCIVTPESIAPVTVPMAGTAPVRGRKPLLCFGHRRDKLHDAKTRAEIR
jgi:hypothetical protein